MGGKNQTIEIRKTMPKCDLPIDVYIYCTKENQRMLCENDNQLNSALKTLDNLGKVVAKFTLNKVEEIRPFMCGNFYHKEMCLTTNELNEYLNNKVGYAWHIDNLVIFDEPKELSEFEHYNLTEKSYRRFPYCDFNLTKAPQSYCFIEVKNE